MKKYVPEIIVGTITYYLANWIVNEELRPELNGFVYGLGAALFINIIRFAINERKLIWTYLNCYVLKPHKEIRLTIAYLFRIEVKGKFLLVKNKRFKAETYQPVGGVYKFFRPEASKVLNQLGVITDDSITVDDKSADDLRLRMPSRKNLRKFLKWFFDSTDRENSPWREFYEELVQNEILSSSNFGFIYYNLVGQSFEPIHFDNHFRVDTFKYVDVYTPRFTNNHQRIELETLLLKDSEDFIWVTPDEIQKGLSNDGKRIAPHTYKIFQTKLFPNDNF